MKGVPPPACGGPLQSLRLDFQSLRLDFQKAGLEIQKAGLERPCAGAGWRTARGLFLLEAVPQLVVAFEGLGPARGEARVFLVTAGEETDCALEVEVHHLGLGSTVSFLLHI